MQGFYKKFREKLAPESHFRRWILREQSLLKNWVQTQNRIRSANPMFILYRMKWKKKGYPIFGKEQNGVER
jgi:hypothetical protein